LDWTFSEAGDLRLGTELAAAAAPVYLELSLLAECRHWCARAISSLDDTTRGGRWELELQSARGLSVMFTESSSEEVRSALERGLALAERLGDLPSQLRLLGRLHFYSNMIGDFRQGLAFAEQSYVIAQQIGDPVALAAAHSLLGMGCHFRQDLRTAHAHLEAALTVGAESQRVNIIHFGIDFRNRANITLARTLWLLGLPDQAARMARNTVAEALGKDHPVTLCIALTWAANVFLWIGDWDTAEDYISRLVGYARSRSIMPYPAAGTGMQGFLAVKRGDVATGISLIKSSLESLHRHRYELFTTMLNGALAEGLSREGEYATALTTLQEAFLFTEESGEVLVLPELHRIEGDVLATGDHPDPMRAEQCYLRSLELASGQSALSWELRAATSLARLWAEQGRGNEAVQMLNPILARFTEGFATPDYQHAKRLINELPGPATT
jgi:tetratricopeptide (TPR) repeat protein